MPDTNIVSLKRATTAMTKGEREDLQKLIRAREKVMKSAAAQRAAEMIAEFEQQLASRYSWDQDETWREAHEAAAQEAKAAEEKVAARCEELGIPKRFAPGITLGWYGRGENASKERRQELTRVAISRIAAIEKAAVTAIEMKSLEAQSQVLAHGLTTDAAIEFFNDLPKIEALMPPLEVKSVEQMVQSRKRE